MSEQIYDWSALLSEAGITPPSNPTSLRQALAAIASAAGGGGAWGQTSTAKFSGSGSPVGVVTPSGEGDLYVDDTTPGLWQATGATSADWSQQGGTSVQGASIVRKFPFAYNTPGILTGAALYTPTVGDILLDAWIEIDTAWDGTTPYADIGYASNTNGLFNQAFTGLLSPSQALDVSVATYTWPVGGDDLVLLGNAADLSGVSTAGIGYDITAVPAIASVPSAQQSLVAVTLDNAVPALPAKFATDTPVCAWVSQNGRNNGADPGSTTGAAILYLVTATPA